MINNTSQENTLTTTKFTPYSATLKDRTPSIHVLDAICGQGKSTRIIKLIQESDINQKYIILTPLLEECHRFAGTSFKPTDQKYKRPIIVNKRTGAYKYDKNAPLFNRRFKHPYFTRDGGKATSLPHLIKNKENIVSTHQLFSNLTQDVLKDAEDYVLIIDETLSVYEILKEYGKDEVDEMIANKWVYLDEDGVTLIFDREKYAYFREDKEIDPTKHGKYKHFATLCDTRQLTYIGGKVVVWEISIEILRAFKSIIIATYMFEGSLMSSYLKNRDIPYTIEKFGIKPSDLKHLINIYDSNRTRNLNTVGNDKYSLSATNFKENRNIDDNVQEKLASTLETYFRKHCKAKKDNRLWTCFKDDTQAIGGKKYKGEFLAFNTRAVNDYRHVQNVAYLVNVFPHGDIETTASKKGNKLNRNMYALSEMIQFIFRSAIRCGEPINLYVPSSRMRDLFQRWLNDEFENTVIEDDTDDTFIDTAIAE